jgi:hypothetical protein
MAKEPEIVELCRIHADTTLDQMGHVFAALSRLGLTNIGYELITEVSTFKQKQSHDVKAEDFAKEWLKEHPTFKVGELVKHFEANGRTAGAAYTAVRNLVEKNDLKKLDPGNYQRHDVKAIAAPEKPGTGTHPKTNRFLISGKDAIWRHIKNRKQFKTTELAVLFRAQGRAPHSASPIVHELLKEGRVKRITDGEYAVLRKAVSPAKKKETRNQADRDRRAKQKAEQQKQTSLNGSDNLTTESSHG